MILRLSVKSAGAEKVVTNEKLNKIPDNIMELTNTYLEEQIKEIKSNKE